MHMIPPLLCVSILSLDEWDIYTTYEASILTQVMVFIVVAWRVKSGTSVGSYATI
jgi:hypothetical protein